MKSEPLKNKQEQMCSCEEHNKDMDYNSYFWKGDIKSAVKYLKESLNFTDLRTNDAQKFLKNIYNKIDKAFEDLFEKCKKCDGTGAIGAHPAIALIDDSEKHMCQQCKGTGVKKW